MHLLSVFFSFLCAVLSSSAYYYIVELSWSCYLLNIHNSKRFPTQSIFSNWAYCTKRRLNCTLCYRQHLFFSLFFLQSYYYKVAFIVIKLDNNNNNKKSEKMNGERQTRVARVYLCRGISWNCE